MLLSLVFPSHFTYTIIKINLIKSRKGYQGNNLYRVPGIIYTSTVWCKDINAVVVIFMVIIVIVVIVGLEQSCL